MGSEEISDIEKTGISHTVLAMKNHRTSRNDKILIEMIQEDGREVLTKLCDIFNTCLKKGKSKTIGIIILHEKEYKTDPDNYLFISLLSQVFKLFTKILTNRWINKLGNYQPADQVGCRRDYGIGEHLLTMICCRAL